VLEAVIPNFQNKRHINKLFNNLRLWPRLQWKKAQQNTMPD